jgi:hypothetical protein
MSLLQCTPLRTNGQAGHAIFRGRIKMFDSWTFRSCNSLVHAETGTVLRIRPAAGPVAPARMRPRAYSGARGEAKSVQVTLLDDGSVMFAFDVASLRSGVASPAEEVQSDRRTATKPNSPHPPRERSSGRRQHNGKEKKRRSVSSGRANNISPEVSRSQLRRDADSQNAGQSRRRSCQSLSSPEGDEQHIKRQHNSPTSGHGSARIVQDKEEAHEHTHGQRSAREHVAVQQQPEGAASQNGATPSSNTYITQLHTDKRNLLSKEKLGEKTVKELHARCKELGLKGYSALRKAELIDLLASS